MFRPLDSTTCSDHRVVYSRFHATGCLDHLIRPLTLTTGWSIQKWPSLVHTILLTCLVESEVATWAKCFGFKTRFHQRLSSRRIGIEMATVR
ncbi:hypothetical protein NPIL_631221 [Nephila pilipes]|uniref:Uncharacterized protein n=1 Tax=Nephila pilipes TaxID=299642 RepID=A0A8X6QBS2_NEPPI|nr:hypothetical protein NPIL_631221 [Nephila pilipes]